MKRTFLVRSTFLAIVFISAALLSACGPIYDTQYTFIPPDAPEGKMCVMQCENMKMHCEQMEDMRKDRCDDREELDYERCKSRGDDHCYRSWCSVDYTKCETRHRSCFQSCGGRVEAQKVCVGFCEGASQ